ncbi:ribosomal protein S18-alanine N-acetyltransferase [Shewanella sp. JNE9-1]|uniref:ribosomal protein S18-alanine N-acetyltransferase n=1 Tax=unclassified Shewanella TaxID=196818 RepID=UPI003981334C
MNIQDSKILNPQLTLVRLGQMDVPQMVSIEASAHSHPMSEGNLADCFGTLYRVYGLSLAGEMSAETLIGFAIIQQILDEVTLLDICLAPEHQGYGYGKLLLSEVIEAAKTSGAVVVMLEVRESNLAARALYQKIGFTESGRRKGYYSADDGREDAILMDFTITSE